MTSLIAWVSRDQRRFAALHVATDSRISWGSPTRRWDAGRKVFASRVTPDVWAYCGDVLFPGLVLSQLVSAGDEGLLFEEEGGVEVRHSLAVETMKASFGRRHNTPDHGFTVLHASREGEGSEAQPRLWLTTFDETSRSWTDEEKPIDEDKAGVMATLGSGAVAVRQEGHRWQASAIGGTSRAIFSAFCEALSGGSDPLSGGSPQLASIYPKRAGVTAGVLHAGELYLHGLPIQGVGRSSSIEWYDELFQRIDPVTRELRKGAARQPRPRLK